MPLDTRQEALCAKNTTDYSDLRAVLVNTTLKKDPSKSHTQLLLDVVGEILGKAGAAVEQLHLLSHPVPPGVYPDMTEHGFAHDGWPDLWPRIRDAEILVVGTPLWLGEASSVCRVLIERLYGMSGLLNEKGQSIFYGRVGGCVITGNEDGMKHAAMTLLYSLAHLGYVIPPQADCGWVGEAGPGPSYGDPLDGEARAGFDNDFTKRNTTIMTWNLLHLARLLKDTGGLPAHGNDREAWKAGCRFEFENPEHRR
jgi:multimeric flavodoxin WrbA